MWVFERGGVVTTNVPYSSMTRRTFVVQYAKDGGSWKRVITAVFVYGVDENSEKERVLSWLRSDAEIESAVEKSSVKIPPKVLKALIRGMSKVVTISDYDAAEKDQQSKDYEKTVSSGVFQALDPDLDDEENPLSLSHFRKYVHQCDVSKCVITITNDSEAYGKVAEVFPPPPQTTPANTAP